MMFSNMVRRVLRLDADKVVSESHTREDGVVLTQFTQYSRNGAVTARWISIRPDCDYGCKSHEYQCLSQVYSA